MIIEEKKKDLLELLTIDIKKGHNLLCTPIQSSQFFELDEILNKFGDFKVDTIVLIDPRGQFHNYFQRHLYIRQAYVEMILNDFEVKSKESQSLIAVPPAIEKVITNLEKQFGKAYSDTVMKLEDPFISRYELIHNGRKLNVYHINYDVVTILNVLKLIKNEEHYSSDFSTGLFVSGGSKEYSDLGFFDIHAYLNHIGFKAHYLITEKDIKKNRFVHPRSLSKLWTIRFETEFLGEYFEMLSS